MKYIEYLDLPQVPEHLLETPLEIWNKPANINPNYKNSYTTRRCTPELLEWVQSIFPFRVSAQYQMFGSQHPVHKDIGRKIAYNYLLDLGGEDVATVVFSDSFIELQREILPLKKWHKIEVSYYHVAHPKPNQRRCSLSVTPLD